MKKSSVITILLLVLFSAVALLVRPGIVKAASCTDFACDGCTGTNQEVKIDLVCQRQRLLNPCTAGAAGCCTLLYCASTDPNTVTPNPTQVSSKTLNFNFFGVALKVDEDKEVASFIYILFSIFFAFVALAVTLTGVYGAFLRSRASSAEDAAKASKLLTNAVVGLILIVLALVFAQFIAGALGIGSLDNLVSFNGVFSSN